jgi:hypothetical protein
MDLPPYSKARGAGADNDDPFFRDRTTMNPGSADQAGQCNGTGALNIIIE